MEPPKWLDEVDSLLTGEAAKWADINPIIKNMLSDENIHRAIGKDINTFHMMFLERFKLAPKDDKDNSILLIQGLVQGPDKPLQKYYQ